MLFAPVVSQQKIVAIEGGGDISTYATTPTVGISLPAAINFEDVLPTPSGTTTTASANLTIATSDSAGYSLYLYASNGDNSLRPSNSANVSTINAAQGDVGLTLNSLEPNTWGYHLGTTAPDDNTVYSAVPAGNSVPIQTKDTSDANSANDIYTLSFGTKIDTTTASGTYSNALTIAVVAEPRRLFNGIDTMQEMTTEICSNAKTDDTTQLIDVRDNKQYWVAKLADGRCWMVQNLGLDLKTTTPLTPNSSDVAADWTPLVDTSTALFNNADDDGTYSYGPGTSASDTHFSLGNYYQYNAATAGSGAAVAGQEAPSSICPKGWTLPSLDEFLALHDSYGLTDEFLMVGSIPMEQPPFYWVPSGYLQTGVSTNTPDGTPVDPSVPDELTAEDSDLPDGEIRHSSLAAYYWTRSGGWTRLNYFAIPAAPDEVIGLHSGMTVRCLVR